MDTALHSHITTAHPAVRRSEPTHDGAIRTALQASVALLVGAVLISVLMVASILLIGPTTLSNPGPMPEPQPQPSHSAGLDL